MKKIAYLFFLISTAFAGEDLSGRLYTKNKENLIFTTQNKEQVQLPSGSRVTKVEDSYILFNPNTHKYELAKLGNEQSTTFSSWPAQDQKQTQQKVDQCLEKSDLKEVFKNEALEAIFNAKEVTLNNYRLIYQSFVSQGNQNESYATPYSEPEKLFAKNNPHFNKLLLEVEHKLNHFMANVSPQELKLKMQKFNKEMLEGNLSFDQMITKINKSYNPVKNGVSFSQDTMYIPLSLDWINANPTRAKWYQEEWVNKAPSPFAGGSGEGISVDDPTDPQSYYNQVKSKLLELKAIIFADKTKSLDNTQNLEDCLLCEDKNFESKALSPEEKWLLSLDEDSFKDKTRMIAIHNETWKNQNTSAWRDYIPVDQSNSCFISNGLLSTLIHESNVNSAPYNYFPQDSHAWAVDYTKEGFLGLNQKNEFEKIKGLIGREPSIQLVYLNMILD